MAKFRQIWSHCSSNTSTHLTYHLTNALSHSRILFASSRYTYLPLHYTLYLLFLTYVHKVFIIYICYLHVDSCISPYLCFFLSYTLGTFSFNSLSLSISFDNKIYRYHDYYTFVCLFITAIVNTYAIGTLFSTLIIGRYSSQIYTTYSLSLRYLHGYFHTH